MKRKLIIPVLVALLASSAPLVASTTPATTVAAVESADPEPGTSWLYRQAYRFGTLDKQSGASYGTSLDEFSHLQGEPEYDDVLAGYHEGWTEG